MQEAADRFKAMLTLESDNVEKVKLNMISKFEEMLADDIKTNKQIGDNGAACIVEKCKKDRLRILTHCNTGSLATAGYGTALGVIRSLFSNGNIDHVFCTETRPYNQGSRLTAFELVCYYMTHLM